MGWTFTKGASRADIVSDCTKPWDTGSADVVCLDKAEVGDVLWAVFERTPRGENAGKASRFIGCFLLGLDTGFGWGSKDLTEAMGPSEVSCPLAFLDMVPEVACEDWRERVRAHHGRPARAAA